MKCQRVSTINCTFYTYMSNLGYERDISCIINDRSLKAQIDVFKKNTFNSLFLYT